MSWEIEFDTADLEKVLQDVPHLAIEALNMTVDFAALRLLKAVTEVYNVPASVLSKKYMKVNHASGQPEASIVLSGKSTPIIHFNAVQTAAGVSFQIKRGEQKSIPSSFIAKMPSGHRGVFNRTGEFSIPSQGKHAGKRKREKIRERFSLSFASMLFADGVYTKIESEVMDFFEEALSNLIDQQLNRVAA